MKVEIELTPHDLRMVDCFRFLKRAHPGRALKSHEIVRQYRARNDPRDPSAEVVFERLKLLGLIHHKRNGDCYLAEQLKEAA